MPGGGAHLLVRFGDGGLALSAAAAPRGLMGLVAAFSGALVDAFECHQFDVGAGDGFVGKAGREA